MYDVMTINAAQNILSNRAEQLSNEELYHHGIFGMKWGVRRYQNEDGSLTTEGEKRYTKMTKGEKMAKMNTVNAMNVGGIASLALTGTVVGGGLGALGGYLVSKKTSDMLSKMSNAEANKTEAYVKQQMKSASKVGRTLAGVGLGAIGGSAIGTAVGIGLGSALGPAGAYVGGIIGATGAMPIGGIIGNKTSDKAFEKRYERWNESPNFEYRKKTKAELQNQNS